MADGGATLRANATEIMDRGRRRTVRRVLLVGLPVAVVVVGLLLWLSGGRYVTTDNATIQSDIVTVAPRVAGTVVAVAVHENQQVRAGEVLFRLDDEPYRIALAQAEARLEQARAQVSALQATWRQRQADVNQANGNLVLAQQEYERQSRLAGSGVASMAALDRARRDLRTAQAGLAAAQQATAAAKAQLAGNPDLPLDQQPAVQAAQAAVADARFNLERATVVAPFDGTVTNVSKLQPGEVMQAGTPAFSLVGLTAWVEANPKETTLTHVAPGQQATVTVDTYPGRTWHARVASVSPATGAQFSVLPPQNATGNWVKVVQRVPVRLALEPEPGAPPLSAGMSAEVSIDTGYRRHISDLAAML